MALALFVGSVPLACGGSGELTKSEFIQEGDDFCKDIRAEIVRLMQSNPPRSEGWQRAVEIDKRYLDYFRDADPPSADRDWYERFLALLELRYELVQEAARAAEKPTFAFPDEYWRVVTRGEDMAKNYGFHECGWERRGIEDA